MKLFTLDAKKHLLNDLDIFTKNQRGDHRRHLHLQRGDHRKISKNSKLLQTLQNVYDIIKNYFFYEIIYFGRKKTSFE